MKQALIYSIEHKLKESGQSTYALEKKAGLKTGTLANIIQGRSKNPTIDTILALAKELDFSLDSLISADTENFKNEERNFTTKILYDGELFLKCAKEVDKLLKNSDTEISADTSLKLLKEVYNYSYSQKNKVFDADFMRWYYESYFA